MDPFPKLVADKANEGDSEWLAKKLLELYEINAQLAAANQELRARIDQLQTALIIARHRKRGSQG